MAWFKKKEDDLKGKPGEPSELPELPKLPRLPELSPLPPLPDSGSGLNPPATHGTQTLPELPETKPLPSFSGKLGEEFSQEVVKSAISQPTQSAYLPETGKNNLMKGKRTLEIAEWDASSQVQSPSLPTEIMAKTNIPKPTLNLPTSTRSSITRKTDPIYVRIDKFKSAVKSFEEIKVRVTEIESLLGKIREVKQKEDQELREWEQEVETIKARIDSIDTNIFSKLD